MYTTDTVHKKSSDINTGNTYSFYEIIFINYIEKLIIFKRYIRLYSLHYYVHASREDYVT